MLNKAGRKENQRRSILNIFSIVSVVSMLLMVSSTVLAQSNDLSISIDFSDENMGLFADDTFFTIDLNSQEAHFDVIITNISQRPVSLWETWNSWGWYNLSFEILDDSNNIVHVFEKRPTVWTRNFPSYVILNPDEQLVIDVCLMNSDWTLPAHEEDALRSGGIRAVYTIPEDDETQEYGVWTGKIESDILRIRY